MEIITHFGLQIKNEKNNLKLNEQNYCKVSNIVSIAPFCNWFFNKSNYRFFPKTFILNYLKSLINFYNNLGKKLSSTQAKNLFQAKEILNFMQALEEDADKVYISEFLKNLKKDYCLQNVQLFQNKILKILADYDFSASIEGKVYSQSWCDKKLKDVKQNFELNMKYFNSLSNDEFNTALNMGLKKIKNFHEVTDLTTFWNKPGYYILVLDNYKQIYVGTTYNLTKRIKEHWLKKKPFDRLIFPANAVTTSLISIDAFKALDTTRIFIYQTKNIYSHEDNYISVFPAKFILNRVNGGRIPNAILHSESLKER